MDTIGTLPRSLTIRRARLAMLTELWLETNCPCGGHGLGAVGLLIDRYGPDVTVDELLPRLRCKQCGSGELAVYLVEGPHREPSGGPSPGWSLALHRIRPEKVPA